MLGFKAKPADVLSHWYTAVPKFTAPTQDFYAAVENELKEQQVPGLAISRVEFSEGGLLSDKRAYLRMTRERLVFDICAAPFGTNYFYSCRFAQLPVQVSVFAIIILFLAGIFLFASAVRIFGFFLTCFLGAALLVIGVYTLRNLLSLGLADLDATLLKLPLFGPVYERFFRKETYYREDTRLMYLTVVEGVVKKLVESETAAKGIRLLTQYEYGPILGELYKARPFGVEAKGSVDDRHVEAGRATN
jgi:hypothetical protein